MPREDVTRSILIINMFCLWKNKTNLQPPSPLLLPLSGTRLVSPKRSNSRHSPIAPDLFLFLF